MAKSAPRHDRKSGQDKVAPPVTLGGTAVMMHLGVADFDDAVKRAVAAGATVTMEPWDAFWGSSFAFRQVANDVPQGRFPHRFGGLGP